MPFTIICMAYIIRILHSILTGLLFFAVLVSLPAGAAEEIELPEEELAKESVLPVFDKTVVVRNRAVKLSERFEASLSGGLNLLEPFYTNLAYSFGGAYHFDEMHGISASIMFLQTDLSSNAEALKNGEGIDSPYDPSLGPTIESLYFANYQFTAYYGKVSVTKSKAMNLSLYGLAGLGLVNWTDSTSFALNTGFGQKLYFTPNIAFRMDLNLAIFQGPDVTSKDLPTGGQTRGSDYFEETLFFRTYLTAGLAVLF